MAVMSAFPFLHRLHRMLADIKHRTTRSNRNQPNRIQERREGHQNVDIDLSTNTGELRYRVRYRKPDGTQTDRRGFKTQEGAQLWEADHVTVAIAKGSYVDPASAKSTIGDLWPAWIAKKKVNAKPSYLDDLEGAYGKYVAAYWANIRIGKVSRAGVQQWVGDMPTGASTARRRARASSSGRTASSPGSSTTPWPTTSSPIIPRAASACPANHGAPATPISPHRSCSPSRTRAAHTVCSC